MLYKVVSYIEDVLLRPVVNSQGMESSLQVVSFHLVEVLSEVNELEGHSLGDVLSIVAAKVEELGTKSSDIAENVKRNVLYFVDEQEVYQIVHYDVVLIVLLNVHLQIVHVVIAVLRLPSLVCLVDGVDQSVEGIVLLV